MLDTVIFFFGWEMKGKKKMPIKFFLFVFFIFFFVVDAVDILASIDKGFPFLVFCCVFSLLPMI